ncbi:hypothetical protein EKH55_0317 [Sinorhizobium alkalisoli]|nr:hypothetical protein EKH55_0317 [Sinorhizobium alkalisoli]
MIPGICASGCAPRFPKIGDVFGPMRYYSAARLSDAQRSL